MAISKELPLEQKIFWAKKPYRHTEDRRRILVPMEGKSTYGPHGEELSYVRSKNFRDADTLFVYGATTHGLVGAVWMPGGGSSSYSAVRLREGNKLGTSGAPYDTLEAAISAL